MKRFKTQLVETLKTIDRNIQHATSEEALAILLNAKATTLAALQKYEH
ncbi:hypothetical protein [Salimicrobium halophilum]|uniref:Uncharacterized protein n=1 Tax=Salimicrobium halophilum TaxID=86666 RepID=A0A1G8WFM8_9BACI|nr:hypothetical protein [Salimicrobium halophilum]SDJ76887.1 hypothetical protein SAMN04490247_3168 [Salimicrobium halophilum]